MLPDPLGQYQSSSNSYDFIVIGSGFGGSVSAYRLSQKGYRVLVVEKGKRYTAEKFAKSNWNLRKWIWMPFLGLKGIMQITPLKHVTVMSGVGVGGGSLVYGATLPKPKPDFFRSGSWAGLEDWETELAQHYDTALKMLGATENPILTSADEVIRDLAVDMNRVEHFRPSTVGIYFGDDKKSGPATRDPFFDGQGPSRSPCQHCGACMLGCPNNSKNSLDKNYLYLANKLGAEVIAETVVENVLPAGEEDGSAGYFVVAKSQSGFKARRKTYYARSVIFSAGVMGTVPLLLSLKAKGSLRKLSATLGKNVRTNNETITSVTSADRNAYYTTGVTIGSILEVDDDSHVEPIVQGPRSGAWRLLILPRTSGRTFLKRLQGLFLAVLRKPRTYLRLMFARDWSTRTFALLFMQHLDSTVSFNLGKFGALTSSTESGPPPSANIPASDDVTRRVEKLVEGTSFSVSTEALLGTPSTAHILGGCVMGSDSEQGVIDKDNQVFGYKNLYVCDGSAISANPGVNPSLSITAITERAMSKVPSARKEAREDVSGRQACL